MAVVSSGRIDTVFKVWPELSLLGLSELLRIYTHEDVCCEKFVVALNGLEFVKIM